MWGLLRNVVPLTEINKTLVDTMTMCEEKIKVQHVDQQSWIQSHPNDNIKSA